jgi:hypothetical protein
MLQEVQYTFTSTQKSQVSIKVASCIITTHTCPIAIENQHAQCYINPTFNENDDYRIISLMYIKIISNVDVHPQRTGRLTDIGGSRTEGNFSQAPTQ